MNNCVSDESIDYGFLFASPEQERGTFQYTVVVNWTAELKR